MATVRLFPLDGSRSHDAAVERWFLQPPPELRTEALRWFSAMRHCGPDVQELLHDGHPTACVAGIALGYVAVFSSHVNVGFYLGASLQDPAGLLEGTGRFMRHVKVRPGAGARDADLQALIAQAYADLRARLADGRQADPGEQRPAPGAHTLRLIVPPGAAP